MNITMPNITDKDRIKEYENLKAILDELDVAVDILEAGEHMEQSCLLISLPTDVEDWKEEFKSDLHIATGHLTQLGEDEEQLTKYLLIYVPIQVDLKGLDELTRLRLVNDTNRTLPLGTCFCGEEAGTDRVLLQIKCLIGGCVDEYLDEGVVCEAVFELGYIYDSLKDKLVEMGGVPIEEQMQEPDTP